MWGSFVFLQQSISLGIPLTMFSTPVFNMHKKMSMGVHSTCPLCRVGITEGQVHNPGEHHTRSPDKGTIYLLYMFPSYSWTLWPPAGPGSWKAFWRSNSTIPLLRLPLHRSPSEWDWLCKEDTSPRTMCRMATCVSILFVLFDMCVRNAWDTHPYKEDRSLWNMLFWSLTLNEGGLSYVDST